MSCLNCLCSGCVGKSLRRLPVLAEIPVRAATRRTKAVTSRRKELTGLIWAPPRPRAAGARVHDPGAAKVWRRRAAINCPRRAAAPASLPRASPRCGHAARRCSCRGTCIWQSLVDTVCKVKHAIIYHAMRRAVVRLGGMVWHHIVYHMSSHE